MKTYNSWSYSDLNIRPPFMKETKNLNISTFQKEYLEELRFIAWQSFKDIVIIFVQKQIAYRRTVADFVSFWNFHPNQLGSYRFVSPFSPNHRALSAKTMLEIINVKFRESFMSGSKYDKIKAHYYKCLRTAKLMELNYTGG